LRQLKARISKLQNWLKEQADIYFKYKGKKPLTESEQIKKSVYSILRVSHHSDKMKSTILIACYMESEV